MIPKLPSVTLSNGLVVANYSSPHTFLFEDGTVLGKCSNSRAVLTNLHDNEQTLSEIVINKPLNLISYSNVRIEWELSWYVQKDLLEIMKVWSNNKLEWDIIIVPLPVMIAWNKYRKSLFTIIPRGPFRVVRLVDRLEPKRVSINKFCV